MVSKERVALLADDIGFLSGVVIVDRLRTVNGLGLDVAEHVARFELSCQAVGIELPERAVLIDSVSACVDRNRAAFAPHDFSVVMLATPGRVTADPPQATLMFQTGSIDWQRLANWYGAGQRLIVSTHRSVPPECWSPAIKTRARMQYYLADRQARMIAGDPYAVAILLDADRFLTETASANVLVVEGDRLVSPRSEKILAGVSLKRTLRLAKRAGYQVSEEGIASQRALKADAILLCGSTGCLWPVAQLEDRVFSDATKHPVYVQLARAWQDELQLDYVRQAQECARLPAT